MSNPATTPFLEFVLYPSGNRGTLIPVSALGRAATAIGALLERMTLEQSGAKPAVRWIVKKADPGSLKVHLDAVPLVEDYEVAVRVRDEVAGGMTTNFDRVEHGEEPEDVFSPESSELALAVLELLQFDFALMVLRQQEREVQLTPEGAGRREPEPSPRRTSIGSIEGILKAISLSGQPYFTVYRPNGGPGVRCYFEPSKDELERIKDALLRRVMVSGRLTRLDDGTPRTVRQISLLRIFDRPDDLPQIDELVGIEPGLTAEMSSEEWLRARRYGQ